MTLPAQNYFQNPADTTPILFAGISIKPKEEWRMVSPSLNYFSRTDEKKYRDAESRLKADIFKEKRKTLENKEDIAEAEKEYIAPFLEMFKENFLWNLASTRFKYLYLLCQRKQVLRRIITSLYLSQIPKNYLNFKTITNMETGYTLILETTLE